MVDFDILLSSGALILIESFRLIVTGSKSFISFFISRTRLNDNKSESVFESSKLICLNRTSSLLLLSSVLAITPNGVIIYCNNRTIPKIMDVNFFLFFILFFPPRFLLKINVISKYFLISHC